MTIHRLTPWAAQRLSPELRETIEAAEPRHFLVTLGRGSAGWTCRILSPRKEGVMAEHYGAASLEQAFGVAYLQLQDVMRDMETA